MVTLPEGMEISSLALEARLDRSPAAAMEVAPHSPSAAAGEDKAETLREGVEN